MISSRRDVHRAHDAQDLRDLVLVVESQRADTVRLQSEPDVRLRLDRMHVEHLGLGGDRPHGLELGRAGDVEAANAGIGQHLEDHRLAIGLHGIGGLSREAFHEGKRVLAQDARPEAIDGLVGSKG